MGIRSRKLTRGIILMNLSLLGLLLPVRQADAHTTVCVGTGTMVTSRSLTYPGLTPLLTAGFSLVLFTGCVNDQEPVTGVMTGWCGAATGFGMSSRGHAFRFDWVGHEWAVTPLSPSTTPDHELLGAGTVLPDELSGQRCVSGASQFLVTGVLTTSPVQGSSPPPLLSANQPPSPNPVSPLNGVSFAAGAPVAFSMSASDPEGHQWIGRVEVRSGSTVVGTYATPMTTSGQTTNTVTPATLPPGTYSWSASATDIDGATSASTVSRTFTVNATAVNAAPGAPVLISPTDGTYPFGTPETFRVRADDPNLDPYRAHITGRHSDGTECDLDTLYTPSGTEAFWKPNAPLPPGSYTWWAVAEDVHGATSPPSATGSFSVTVSLLIAV